MLHFPSPISCLPPILSPVLLILPGFSHFNLESLGLSILTLVSPHSLASFHDLLCASPCSSSIPFLADPVSHNLFVSSFIFQGNVLSICPGH